LTYIIRKSYSSDWNVHQSFYTQSIIIKVLEVAKSFLDIWAYFSKHILETFKIHVQRKCKTRYWTCRIYHPSGRWWSKPTTHNFAMSHSTTTIRIMKLIFEVSYWCYRCMLCLRPIQLKLKSSQTNITKRLYDSMLKAHW